MTSAVNPDFTGRLDLVARAEATINAGSKSFRFASRLFDRRTRERSWLLYAWCRACDDLADGQVLGHDARTPPDPEARLQHIKRQTERALAGEDTGEVPFDALGLVVRECGIPRLYVDDHIAGFALDAAGWRPQSEDDLLRYCYHVAGAVGCMMAVLMGVKPEEQETLDRAADLGIAFQLANIARDLTEDAGVGRIYLPRDWIDAEGLRDEDLGSDVSRAALARMAGRLAALEAHYRRSAKAGAARLPFRSRWAVLAAARIYGSIAERVRDLGESAWDQRVTTTKAEKFRHVIAAWAEARRRGSDEAGRHGLWTRAPAGGSIGRASLAASEGEER
jgi:phytoene synthase